MNFESNLNFIISKHHYFFKDEIIFPKISVNSLASCQNFRSSPCLSEKHLSYLVLDNSVI
ncbi:MAG: hypothetical protein A3A10_02970 [Candidatus Tagabacteria bacterium RIFCSPLOWO2_01_FULL_42_9]|uniref:Uncharacterized protein n=1 Tax=Candidatus Tagabacteria bacterium RIFCSPLOWO2_01_FULL_42_9 TaxID=1802296 RepID=A0A1G2LTF1_9BACT|nr:MAG: hypothetical protein A3A10_02970 [Candidatus Tagabacteria bacterium RIFCSPLOWO2_01_FULL_42_9]